MYVIYIFFSNILECTPGTYGENCDNVCGVCFNNESCNIVNGSCPDGCGPGYHGDGCDLGKTIILNINEIFEIHNMTYKSIRLSRI